MTIRSTIPLQLPSRILVTRPLMMIRAYNPVYNNEVIVWRQLELISALSSKTVGDREKCFTVACQAKRKLPLGAVEAAQWLTTTSVEARVCVYLPG